MTEDLAERVRTFLEPVSVTEQKMFGGVCFMLNGNMLVGASPRGLLVRVGKDGNDAALKRPHTRQMDMGRPAPGYVIVEAAGTKRDKDLQSWLDTAVAYVSTLPAKDKKPVPAAVRKKAAK